MCGDGKRLETTYEEDSKLTGMQGQLLNLVPHQTQGNTPHRNLLKSERANFQRVNIYNSIVNKKNTSMDAKALSF